jgi:hypothetical protein
VDLSRPYCYCFSSLITLKPSDLCSSLGNSGGSSYKLCDGLYVVNSDVTIRGGGTVALTMNPGLRLREALVDGLRQQVGGRDDRPRPRERPDVHLRSRRDC